MPRQKGTKKTGGRVLGSKDKKPRKAVNLFKAGKPKPALSGRKKGSLNIRTIKGANRAEKILQLLENKYLEKDLQRASPTTRINLYSDMLEYTMPKRARVNDNGDSVSEISVTIKRTRKIESSVEGG